jgi:N-sulfoglucosamine sulfohydrolase
MSGTSVSRRELLAGAAAALGKRRPNILLCLADNWAYPHAGACGDPAVRTPVFDRVAQEGVLFTRAFAPNPSCSPSRSMLLSGQESHRLGAAANLYGNMPPQTPVYTGLLESAGYFVGYMGKGWGPGAFAEGGWKRNPAGRQFKSFQEFLSAKPAGAPFCFWFGSHDPHAPWDRGQHRMAEIGASKLRVPAHLPDHPSVREDILRYYCEVEEFDSDCGALLDRLRAAGELDNTFVVITSDNGWQLPRGLANCHDYGVRIPLALRWPAGWRGGQVRTDFVSIADLAPTFLEAAGVARAPQMTAVSLLSSVRRDAVFVERERHANVRRGNLSYPVRGIRTEEFLYLRNFEPDRWPAGDPEYYWSVGEFGDADDSRTKRLLIATRQQPYFDLCLGKRPAEELYDLRKDPGQLKNVAADPSYTGVKRRLWARVEAWMRETGDPRAAGPTDFWDRVPYAGPKRRADHLGPPGAL